ncbi:Gfo/Idh/MocA family protein [Aquisalibacillus elongatus]|uniref:Putative dehydrogenase n=1 Tax=Aquisalibacillus elongatus TaxID=485577 RepID=A0A3N5B983_9BACI|nr:Gfo/Idh/MocA family oxidoreductase [Aquisalibacillus elongatus]RPF54286.1 putative dehydrogenase [Aquisalibacillus elongatus]
MKIGMMSFAHMHAHSYADCLNEIEHVELAAIFDDDRERADQIAKQYDVEAYTTYEEFFEQDLDAVIICSENNRHKEMVLEAAKHQKHILCEKPIATNIEDAQVMINYCEEQNVILQIAFPVRFSSPIMELKVRIDQGELGDIVAFRSTNRGQNPGGWFVDEHYSGGGAVLDHTVHMVDIMRWFLSDEVKDVHAYVDSFFHDVEIDDAGILTMEFNNGVIASHDASWSRYVDYPTWGDVTLEVIGTKKNVVVDAFKEHINVYPKQGPNHLTFDFVGHNMDLALIKDFIQCVEEKRQPFISGHDGLKALQVALCAYQSNDIGQSVRCHEG